jgi:hypothetical protein
MSMLSPTMPTYLRVAVLEDALARACGSRGGNELHVNDQGDRVLRVYDYDTPSAHGGNVFVELNLSVIARDLERELS